MAVLPYLKERASLSKTTFDMFFTRLYPALKVRPVDLQGKRALITGANVGIGKETARALAKMGAEVWLICRNPVKAADARAELVQDTGNERIYVEIVDMSRLESVRAFDKRWGMRTPEERKVDLLFNNAGISLSSKQKTSEGFELTYVTNFLSAFLLTTLLLRRGDFSPDARIIQCASLGAYNSGRLTPDLLNSNDFLDKYEEGQDTTLGECFKLYGRSKAMQVVFTWELQDMLVRSSLWKDVVVQSCHPGNVQTTIWGRATGIGRYVTASKIIQIANNIIGISPAKGALTPVWLLTSQEAAKPELRGRFWDRCIWRWRPAWMEDETLRRALWRRWEEDTGTEGAF